MTATVQALPTIEHTVVIEPKPLIELLAAHSPLPQDPYGHEPYITDILQCDDGQIDLVLVFGALDTGARRIISEARRPHLTTWQQRSNPSSHRSGRPIRHRW